MTDKPTICEFLILSRKDVVKSKGGAYYSAVNARKAKKLHFGLFVAYDVILLIIWIFAAFHVQNWPTRIVDFLILLNIGSLLCLFASYRFIRFERIPENSEAYAAASALKYPSRAATISLWVLGAIMLLLVLQSSGVTYLRYWMGGQARLVSAEINLNSLEESAQNETLPLSAGDGNGGDASVVTLPDLSGNVYIDITTAGSPQPMQLSFDGEPARVYEPLEFRWFWEPDYFLQCGYFNTSYADIHPGSVLTLTCGSLTREWVFTVADKEAS